MKYVIQVLVIKFFIVYNVNMKDLTRNKIVSIVLLFIIILFGVITFDLRNKNVSLLESISSLNKENVTLKNSQKEISENCDNVLFLGQKSEVKGYRFFVKCNFVSGQYGDNYSKNVFGVEEIKTGKKYVIGSTRGIFDQNTILDVINNRYVFLNNSYEGDSRYIMIDILESWPTNDNLIVTVFPKTIDQYVKAGLKYLEIVSKF